MHVSLFDGISFVILVKCVTIENVLACCDSIYARAWSVDFIDVIVHFYRFNWAGLPSIEIA